MTDRASSPGPEFPWPGQPSPGTPPSPGRPKQDPGPVPPSGSGSTRTPDGRTALRAAPPQRIVLASGVLDDAAATRLSAQLLTLDAEGTGPIRLELQNLQAELLAALTLMGVLDVIRAEIQAFASGETGGAALGVLASCPRRAAYPNASFTLSEPKLQFGGTVTAVTAGSSRPAGWSTRCLPHRRGRRPRCRGDPRGRQARPHLDSRKAIGYGSSRTGPRSARLASPPTRGTCTISTACWTETDERTRIAGRCLRHRHFPAAADRDRAQDRAGAVPGRDRGHARGRCGASCARC